jgi:putative PIN family toxin of toxin-antitoxin system
LRVVLDTNIIVSASLTPEGSSATIVERVLAGAISVVLSEMVLREYREVLARPKFSRQMDRAALLLEGLANVAAIVNPVDPVSVCPDNGDNRVLECALAGAAEVVVTGNLKHFPKEFKTVRIRSPREFLLELDS